MGQVYRIIALFTTFACVFAIAPARAEGPRGQAGSPGDPAVLVVGTLRVEGIPGFPKNHIPALFGRYLVGPGMELSVWVTAEPLVFNPAVWRPATVGRIPAQETSTAREGLLLAAECAVKMRPEVDKGGAWTAIIAFGEGTDEALRSRFLATFLPALARSLASARFPADLALPAIIDFTR